MPCPAPTARFRRFQGSGLPTTSGSPPSRGHAVPQGNDNRRSWRSREALGDRADDRAIRTGFRFAQQALGATVAQAYVDHLCPEGEDDELRNAYVWTAALAATKDIREAVDAKSNEIAIRLFDTHRNDIQELTDLRKAEYERIRGLAVDPQRGELGEPRLRMEDYKVVDPKTGDVTIAPLLRGHLRRWK